MRRPWGLSLVLISLFSVSIGCGKRSMPGGGGGGGDADAGPGDNPDGGDQTEVVVCPDPVPAPSDGACDIQSGSGEAVLLRGTVLGQGTVYQNGSVLYQGTSILCTGCDCGVDPAAADATTIACADAVISPALINPHDHITFTEGEPIDHGDTRYDHRHDWRGGLSTPSNPHGTGSTGAGTRWGEVRMMLGGATSMVGSGRADGLVRNLDQLADEDHALGLEDVEFETFSLNDSNEQFHDNCGWDYKFDEVEASEMHAFLPHVAEGIDDYAAEEFRCQSTSFDNGQDFTERNDTHIHGIGLNATDYYNMARDRTRLIWSPRSNISLYGHTAQVQTFDRLGGVVALGTDWTYSGSMNVLRELACADEYNKNNLGGYFSDEKLWQMVTYNAAIATGSDLLLGSLEPGKLADIAIFAAGSGVYHRAVLEAEADDVLLVIKAGRPLFGEADVVDGLEDGGCEALDVCGSARSICLEREFGVTYAALAGQVAAGNPAYPAFFCGAPDAEPTCVPSRSGEFSGVAAAGDPDGDGLADGDNCPDVFNPIRPIDHDVQADVDGDGQGDACDPTPVGEDLDGDTVANMTDNCPFNANADQLDGDEDAKGDMCDYCPDAANPNTVCGPEPAQEATIEEVQTGAIAEGTTVMIRDAVVIGTWSNGVWVQAPGATRNGGIHVFTGPNAGVVIGDQVDASGDVFEYFTDTELENGVVTKTGTATPLAPIELTVAQARNEVYEGMLVRVMDVSQVENPYDCSADNEACADADLWEVNNRVIVYNRLYQDDDWSAQMGQEAPITGVMMTRFDRRRIMPRSSADFGE
jgi:cytosine/adenosine deaminase-related metal-dependent hydrolase